MKNNTTKVARILTDTFGVPANEELPLTMGALGIKDV
jgi:hypothetical protein